MKYVKKYVILVVFVVCVASCFAYKYFGSQAHVEDVKLIDKWYEGGTGKSSARIYHKVELCRNNGQCLIEYVRSSFYDRAVVGVTYKWEIEAREDYPLILDLFVFFQMIFTCFVAVYWIIERLSEYGI